MFTTAAVTQYGAVKDKKLCAKAQIELCVRLNLIHKERRTAFLLCAALCQLKHSDLPGYVFF